MNILTFQGVQELFFNYVSQLPQDCVWTCCWVVCSREMGHRVGGEGRALEGTAKGAKERHQLCDGGQGPLSEEGELKMLCGRFLTQSIQSLK